MCNQCPLCRNSNKPCYPYASRDQLTPEQKEFLRKAIEEIKGRNA